MYTGKLLNIDDYLLVPGVLQTLEFKVVKTNPVPYCVVVPDATICVDGEPIGRKVRLDIFYFLMFSDNRFLFLVLILCEVKFSK